MTAARQEALDSVAQRQLEIEQLKGSIALNQELSAKAQGRQRTAFEMQSADLNMQVQDLTARLAESTTAVSLAREQVRFEYKALHDKDTLHIKHYMIRTLCI